MSKKKQEDKNWFKDETPESRIHLLEDNCMEVTSMPIRKKFTPDEIRDKKEKQVKIAISLDVEDTKKQEFLKEHNLKTKVPKAEHKELIDHIRKGFVDEEMRVFAFDNQDDKVMEYYDDNGICVYERPLLPNERQTNIHTMSKVESNS